MRPVAQPAVIPADASRSRPGHLALLTVLLTEAILVASCITCLLVVRRFDVIALAVAISTLAVAMLMLLWLPSEKTPRALSVEPCCLIVAPDRIELLLRNGIAHRWRRCAGDGVSVVLWLWRRQLRIGATAIAIPARQLRLFDIDQLRAACLAQGWSWQEHNGQKLTAVPAHTAQHYGAAVTPLETMEPELTTVLRDGTDCHSSCDKYVVAGAAVCCIGFAVAAYLLGEQPADPMWGAAVSVAGLIWILAIAGYLAITDGKLRLSVAITGEYLAVCHGQSTTVVFRARTRRVSCQPNQVSFYCADEKRPTLRINANGHKRRILEHLIRTGWSVEQ